MENCPQDPRCLICRRVTLTNSSLNSEKLVSNASRLQHFLNCLHINVPDSQVNELPSSCKFCPTCEQFISEWSSIQTQLTQLTRRAAQLEATFSALLLSAPQIQEEENQDENVTQIIKNRRIQNSQQVLLQQTVHDIRNKLLKKYSVRVMVERAPGPPVEKKLQPFPPDFHNNDHGDGEPWDHPVIGTDNSDEEEDIPGMRMEPEEEASCDDSNLQDSVDSKETKSEAGNNITIACPKSRKKKSDSKDSSTVIPVGPNRFQYKGMSFERNEEDGTYTCDACGFKSLPTIHSIRFHIINHFIQRGKNERQRVLIPDGPNRFKYNGYDVRFNDQDRCYYCGVCNHKGHTAYHSTLAHIKNLHYTAEDKIKFTAVKTSDTEWLYGGKYQIVQVDENKLLCVLCGVVKNFLYELVRHIRTKHVGSEGSAEVVVPLTETDLVLPSVKDSTNDSVHVTSDTNPLPPVVLKVEPLPVDFDNNVDEPWDHWECNANIQLPVVPKIEPLGSNNDGRECDEFGDDHSDDEYLPSEDELEDDETSEQILGMRMETEEEANCYDSEDSKEMIVKAGNSKAISGCPRKKSKFVFPHGPKRFTFKGVSFGRNEDDQTYTCDACSFKGPTTASIFSHLRIHSAGKGEYRPEVIPDGPNRFKYNGYDIRLNDQDNCYYCGICNFNGYSRLGTVLTHIREIHYTAKDKIKFTAVKISKTEWLYGGQYKITKMDDKRFKCESCGSVQSNFQRLVSHIRSKHVNLKGAEEAVPLPVTDTPSVNALTPTQRELESVPYSINPTDKKYFCGSPESQASTWDNLVSHIPEKPRAPPKKFPCEICGSELSSKKAYTNHIKRHQISPMTCPTCSRQFLDGNSFKKHMELHELGEKAKKYQCEDCGKKFLYLNVFKNHQRLHTGELPYQCQVCAEKFTATSYLTRHRQSAHGIQPKSRRVIKDTKKLLFDKFSMEDCPGDRRCLICCLPTLRNLSGDSQTLVPNASFLQDFLNCFRNNILGSEINDLSTPCQFCPTCEQFTAEWSSIQTQMAQLTQRAAKIQATQ